MAGDSRRTSWLAAAVALTAAVFAADVLFHLAAAPVPYGLAVWLAYGYGSRRAIWTTAAVGSLLTLLGFLAHPVAGEQLREALANRGLALLAVWATAIPCALLLAERFARERLADIVESSDEAILSADRNGRITSWNRGAERLFGYAAAEALGRPVSVLMPDELRDEGRRLLERALDGEPVSRHETVRVRKDGERRHVAITLSPIYAEDGRVGGVAAVGHDITDRKHLEQAREAMRNELERRVEERTRELERLNRALERSNLELRQFAYAASHDLQSPLRSIVAFSQFLQSDYAGRLDETADDYLERIVRGGGRMQRLIQDLLELSRVDGRAGSFGPVHLNEAFDEAVELLHAAITGEAAEVTRADLPTVHGERTQIVRLLQNLIDNALKYRGDDPPRVRVSAELEGGCWIVSVRDNGIGIAPDDCERIFETFERLHGDDEQEGAGLGLAICRRILDRHGGRIWVESEQGEGSVFRFSLPAETASASSAA